MNVRRFVPVFVLLGIVVLVQLVCTLTRSEFFLTQIIMSAYYSLVIIGLCLLMGYAGQISLGQAGFFAVGGYTQAFLVTVNLAPYKTLSIVAFAKSIGFLISWQDIYGNEIL